MQLGTVRETEIFAVLRSDDTSFDGIEAIKLINPRLGFGWQQAERETFLRRLIDVRWLCLVFGMANMTGTCGQNPE